jgi:hypothetical protein
MMRKIFVMKLNVKMNESLYVEIDPKENKILSPPKPLEINWKNIGGLSFLTDDKLNDLSWAGYENSGFIKFNLESKNILRCFSYDPTLIDQIKMKLKEELSNIRYEYECGGIVVNNQYSISTDDRAKILLQSKYLQCMEDSKLTFYWKTSSGFYYFTSQEFITLFKKITEFIQKCFDYEKVLIDSIEECKDLIQLLYVKLDKNTWNFNVINL